MKIINGDGAILGRLASYVAKEALKGEEIKIINCDNIIITGNKNHIKKIFQEKRERVGSSQKGPKNSRENIQVVKRVIRGMLPDFRTGRGNSAWKRIKCYEGFPKGLEKSDLLNHQKKIKSLKIKEIYIK